MLFFVLPVATTLPKNGCFTMWAIHANMVFVSVVYHLESGFNYEPPMVLEAFPQLRAASATWVG